MELLEEAKTIEGIAESLAADYPRNRHAYRPSKKRSKNKSPLCTIRNANSSKT